MLRVLVSNELLPGINGRERRINTGKTKLRIRLNTVDRGARITSVEKVFPSFSGNEPLEKFVFRSVKYIGTGFVSAGETTVR